MSACQSCLGSDSIMLKELKSKCGRNGSRQNGSRQNGTKNLVDKMGVDEMGVNTSSVFSPEFLGRRAQIMSMTTPLILNVVILSTKHLLHVYHCQQRILSQVQCSQSSVVRAQTVLKFK